MEKLGGAHAVGLSSWAIAIVMAFASSLDNGLLVSLGYVSQWALKAPVRVRDWVAPVVTFGVGFGIYWLRHQTATFDEAWITACATWCLAAIGIASASGRTGGAPKTNTL